MIGKNDIIIIDNGATFEGTVSQFKDCFFTNVNHDTIKQWCEIINSTFEIKKG